MDNVCTYTPLDRVGPETYRRAVYHQNARASVVDVLADFDFPDTAFAAPRRANTTTPFQALTLLNHSFTLDMAAALAARVHGAPDEPARIRAMYRLVFQRAADGGRGRRCGQTGSGFRAAGAGAGAAQRQ